MSNNRNRRRGGKNRNHAADIARRDDPFSFVHDGQVFRLPSSRKTVKNMKAGALIDAVMDETDRGQLRLAWSTLMASDPEPESIEALRDMEVGTFAHTVQKWFKAGGVEPGKSGSSSD